MNITFVGLGKLGLPCAEAIAQKGHNVHGYDVQKRPTQKVFQYPTLEGALIGADIVFVAVPTPHEAEYDGSSPTSHLPPKDFDYTIVKQVLAECNNHMKKDQMLVLISTVLPGTVRREFIQLTKNTRFIYNPYLIAMGSVAWDMVNPEMIIIGTEDGTQTGDAKQLVDFYDTIMENNPRYVIGTWDECECIKVFYNTFISTKITLTNMIQDVAVKQGNIDASFVTDALAKSTQRIISDAYMKPGMGDGGACHPRDNIALRYLAKELDLGYDLFDSIMQAREKQAENMALEILKHGHKVKFSSDSYKPGVKYTDGSYSLLVQHYIKEHGGWANHNNPTVYVLVHPGDKPMQGVYNFDPWKEYGTKH
jgi:UDPglucose 6-dehydrogenase